MAFPSLQSQCYRVWVGVKTYRGSDVSATNFLHLLGGSRQWLVSGGGFHG